jgi:hypothetical protein
MICWTSYTMGTVTSNVSCAADTEGRGPELDGRAVANFSGGLSH